MKSPSLASAASRSRASRSSPLPTRGLIVATTIGNGFEFFDLTVYSFFAVLLGKLFFPLASTQQQLLLSVGTFGVGFVARPLGGVLFGVLADRFGRVAAMNVTLLTMAAGTGLIGVTPTYAQIGIAAPLIVLAARLLQGFSAGGEVGVATALLAERAEPERRGFVTSWQFASQGAAALAGSLVGFLLSHFLDRAALESWGWRVPFLAGVLIAPLGLYLRARIGEEPAAGGDRAPGGVLRTVFRRDGRLVLLAFLLVIGGTSAHFIVLYYMSTYAIKVLHLPMDSALWCGILAGAVMLVMSPLGGAWSDRFGRKRVTFISRALLTLSILPGFYLIGHVPGVATLYAVVCVLAALHSINAGANGTLLPEMFPRSTRATGLSIAYAAGVSIFGGFAQFIVTWLIAVTGDPVAPAWYVIACGVLSLFALAFVTDRTRDAI
ncbi:MFS transporter [Paraburkholderia caballeronis]|uniref:Major Facilitator Superfamily protein n=1 Tax=Paraburkholderia caballeronis TaxID=416943 RepID=A0A1H7LE41_9BURK|nr:MFS transporter [Paraburkholderia caballeronis]PXW28406.1 MFS transporter [Paraburkholderia caballeronis]PXX03772.1 MFS transporter [Paraburkholderia caballeronis]RAK04516.1 MFS transporter [Paraburkholderia caballeronis]SED76898.1 Major Facilitator Superfamily protein [Paraburkholderia caballeronis]SEK96765.1 Major Facilitator Superfamily protein [Paraburkholderia caballeronis]